MNMVKHTYGATVRLEERLWQMETRYDEALIKQSFAGDFFEFGQSGRVFTRSDILFERGKARVLSGFSFEKPHSAAPCDACCSGNLYQ